MKMAKLPKRSKGFTLLETCITFLIFIGIFSIGYYQLQEYQDKQEFTQTVKNVKLAIEQASRYATIDNQLVMFTRRNMNDPNYSFKNGKNHKQQLKISLKIKIISLEDLKVGKGGNSKPTTIIIKSAKYRQ